MCVRARACTGMHACGCVKYTIQICDNLCTLFNCMGDYDVSSILTPHKGITFYIINYHV
jgi:hypothetical protein